MYRVVFHIDHKHRDLPSMALIAFFLGKRGLKTYFCSSLNHNIINNINPDFIIMSKFRNALNNIQHWIKSDCKIIIIQSEGNLQAKENKYVSERDKYLFQNTYTPDLTIFWNYKEMHKYSIFMDKNKQKIFIGCPRLDFLKPKFMNLYPSKEKILKNLNLDKSKFTITLATSIGLSHANKKILKSYFDGYKGDQRKIIDLSFNIKNQKKLRITTEKIIRFVAKNKDLQLIIKPHPNESIIHWESYIKKFNNIKLCYAESINYLLRSSDFHLAHNACTTSLEAQLLNIPCAQILSDDSYSYFKKDHIDIAYFKIKSVKDFETAIYSYQNKTKSDLIKFSNKYVKKYFTKFNGNICKEHSNYLIKFMKRYKPKNKKLIDPYIFFKIFFRLKNLTNKSNIDQRGRVDNRIIPGDENYWFNKFTKMFI